MPPPQSGGGIRRGGGTDLDDSGAPHLIPCHVNKKLVTSRDEAESFASASQDHLAW